MAHALREFAELARHTPYAACELLAASKQLEKQGEPARAAMLAWLCRDDFPEAAADAAALLHRIDTLIPGVLFGDHLVWVSSRALAAGGSWLWLAPSEPHLLPTAWDPEVLDSFSGFLSDQRSRVLVDVGANTGSFAQLGVVHPGLTVHAVEPNPDAVAMLRRHLRANDLEASTTVHECALSDASGSAVLGLPRQTGLATIGSLAHLTERVELVVNTVTLDELVEREGISQVDAIKLDTEGHELRVLQGAREVIARWHPVLLLEGVEAMMARHGYGWPELWAFLYRNGYTVTRWGPEDVLAVAPEVRSSSS